MGPTQSVMAWGCADEEQEHKEELGLSGAQGPKNEKEAQHHNSSSQHQDVPVENQPAIRSPSLHAMRETAENHPASRSQSLHSMKDTAENRPASRSQSLGSVKKPESVRVNPVYELSLCPRFREIIRSGSLSPSKNERKSIHTQTVSVEDQSPVGHEERVFDPNVVSVQPRSLLPRSSEVNTATGTENNHTTTAFRGTDMASDTRIKVGCGDDTEAVNQNQDQLPNADINTGSEYHQETVITQPAETDQDENKTTEDSSDQSFADQPAELPGGIMLSLPEPFTTVFNSVSTPPDETSPMLPVTAVNSCVSTPVDETSPPLSITPADSPVTTPADETSPVFEQLSEIGISLTDDGVAYIGSPESGEDAEGGNNNRFSYGSDAGAAASGAAEHIREPKKRKGSGGKSKKKEEKSIEHVLRTLSNLSEEEKLKAICKKYTDLQEEHRIFQSSLKQHQRKMTMIHREKEQAQSEYTKAVVAKSRLESLCRELQKQNKAVKEESILRAKEDEKKRKEICTSFQKTIDEIQTKVSDNQEQNLKLREENQNLAGKLKKFLEQHDLREQQLDKLVQHRNVERELAEAKLDQAAAILEEEQTQRQKEKELMLLETKQNQKKNAVLETQLNIYKDRYEEFQGTISRSSDMFQQLKSEMDKMGKRIKKLEKEGAQWKSKWETSKKTVQDMTEEKALFDEEKKTLQKKVEKLESLCRALQKELHEKGAQSLQPSFNDSPETAPSN